MIAVYRQNGVAGMALIAHIASYHCRFVSWRRYAARLQAACAWRRGGGGGALTGGILLFIIAHR